MPSVCEKVIVNDPKPTTEPGEHAKPAPAGPPDAETIARRRAVAEALSKEQGYNSVVYAGGDRF